MLELVIPIIGMEMEILIIAMDGGEDSDADDDDGNLGVSPPEAAPPVGLLAPLDHLIIMMIILVIMMMVMILVIILVIMMMMGRRS